MPLSLVPESPTLLSACPSPDIRQQEPSGSRHAPTPRFLADPSPSSILALLNDATPEPRSAGSEGKGKGNDLRSRLILRHAVVWAVERGDVELVAWLTSLDGPWRTLLDAEVQDIEDEDGWGLVGMAIQASCGRQDIEESVRLVVGRWGINLGPRGGTDRSGWTPLHLAALVSTPPLISFLLNRGASPHALTHRGLTPLDLVAGVPDRMDIAVFLEHSAATGPSPAVSDSTSLSARRQAVLSRRRDREAERLRKMDEEEREWAVEQEREKWVRDMAGVIEVSPEILIPRSKRRRPESSHDSEFGDIDVEDWREEMEEEQEEEEDVEEELLAGPSRPDADDTMLVFALADLPAILDILITTYRPVCSPLDKRSLPANALYLHARFAFYRCDESWLEELLDGAVERIEQGVYANAEDLAYLAFWAYNTTVLLHLLQSDKDLANACDSEEVSLLGMMEELINAIHVFIIRVAERRIDTILDPALLDYEALEDFNDVRFEGEWSLFRSFGAKKRREILPKASQIFSGGAGNSAAATSEPVSSPSLLGTLRDNVAAASPLKSLAKRASMQDLRGGQGSRSVSSDSTATVSGNGATTMGEAGISPRQITDILSAVLMVLQLYEVNPAMTIQAFSQIFFWIACELFNRVLTRKKYLCRSKAVQIRMNITVLENWVRANGLPTQTATRFFDPVNQLLTWLQCLSQVREFDTLIGTMQTLKSINPLQMRRAVRDYRYEVNEGRMTDECAQYLAQLQRDWENRRLQMSLQAAENSRRGLASEVTTSLDMVVSTPIDDLFDGTTALADFVPQTPPECFGELLDSRYMLPFFLPSETEYLVATPPTGAAFFNASISTTLTDGSRSSRPSSRSSYASSRPMGWALPEPRSLRRLPRDFFSWLKEREAEQRHRRDALGPKSNVQPALDPPLGPSQRIAIATPTRTTLDTRLLAAVNEDEAADEETTPVKTSGSFPTKLGDGLPSPGLRVSDSLDQLRGQTQIPFEVVRRVERQDSFEMKPRSSPTSSSIRATSPREEMAGMQCGGDVGSEEVDGFVSHSSLTDPFGPEGERAGGRKRWWTLGRAASDGSVGSVGGEGERRQREASEDTVVRV